MIRAVRKEGKLMTGWFERSYVRVRSSSILTLVVDTLSSESARRHTHLMPCTRVADTMAPWQLVVHTIRRTCESLRA